MGELKGLGFTRWLDSHFIMLKVSHSAIHRRVTGHGLEGLSKLSDRTDTELHLFFFQKTIIPGMDPP